MTLSFVILSLELTLFDKNFDDIVKYNSSKVTLTKNYIYTQCDAGNINGYELTVENSFQCSQRTCLREMSIFTDVICIILLLCVSCVIYYSHITFFFKIVLLMYVILFR